MIPTQVMAGFFSGLLALSLFSAAAEECGVFCTIGKWWGSLTGGGNAAGKGETVLVYNGDQIQLGQMFIHWGRM